MPEFVTLHMQMQKFPFDEVVREHPWFHLAMIKAFGKILDISTDSASEKDAKAWFPGSQV